ncbi:MAG: GxxExxY protein [Verrucomicrobiota bacterium]
MNENGIGTIVVDCAVELHRDLGPGLLETVYEVTLARALERRRLRVQHQVAVAIEYRGEVFHEGFRADLIVENLVIVELKSVERVSPAHKKQVLTYLRLIRSQAGLSAELWGSVNARWDHPDYPRNPGSGSSVPR